jgi:hypothetical protein
VGEEVAVVLVVEELVQEAPTRIEPVYTALQARRGPGPVLGRARGSLRCTQLRPKRRGWGTGRGTGVAGPVLCGERRDRQLGVALPRHAVDGAHRLSGEHVAHRRARVMAGQAAADKPGALGAGTVEPPRRFGIGGSAARARRRGGRV